MTITSHHTQVCFDAWMNCENLITSLAELKISISKKLNQALDDCALICMGTFQAIKSGSNNLNRVALLCVGICEECADLCEEQQDSTFQECARICRQCSDALSYIAFPAAIHIAEPSLLHQ